MTEPAAQEKRDHRRSTGEKILAVVDVVAKVCDALLRLFGRRRTDPKT